MLYEVVPEDERFMTSVPYTVEFYKLPVVGISSRSSILSNTVSLLATIPMSVNQSSCRLLTSVS